MSVTKRVVLPIAKLVVGVVIAIALCVIAFRQTAPAMENEDPGGVAPPGAQFEDPTVTVVRDTIRNDVTVSGSVMADPAIKLTAPASGTVVYVGVESGQQVADKKPLLTLRSTVDEPVPAPAPSTDSDSETGDDTEVVDPAPVPANPQTENLTVAATATGQLKLTAKVNDEVAAGDELGTIDPKINFVSATVPPATLYRLIDLPSTAEVTVTEGPPPFDCTDLVLESAAGEDGATTTTLRCEIPEDVVVFPGLDVSISVTADTSVEALTVPMSSVLGTYEAGSVWVVDGGGESVETPVRLGINDGENIVVLEGLDEGQTVLQFVPGADPQYPGGPDGGGGIWTGGGDFGGDFEGDFEGEGSFEGDGDGEWVDGPGAVGGSEGGYDSDITIEQGEPGPDGN